eukprot:222414_1
MIHLILVAEPPQIPTQDIVHDFVDSLCYDIANDQNTNSVCHTSYETSISSVIDTSHQPHPQTRKTFNNYLINRDLELLKLINISLDPILITTNPNNQRIHNDV